MNAVSPLGVGRVVPLRGSVLALSVGRVTRLGHVFL